MFLGQKKTAARHFTSEPPQAENLKRAGGCISTARRDQADHSKPKQTRGRFWNCAFGGRACRQLRRIRGEGQWLKEAGIGRQLVEGIVDQRVVAAVDHSVVIEIAV